MLRNTDFLTALGQIASAFAALILTVLTWRQVRLTNEMLRESRNTFDLEREVADKQFRVQTIPHLYCGVVRSPQETQLALFNVGSVPAYDVEVLAVGVQDESTMSARTFVQTQLREDMRDVVSLEADEEGSYGVYDRLTYSVFPSAKKVIAPLRFSIPPGTCYVLLQYRSMLGENFSQVYWFYEDYESATGAFRLADVTPDVIAPAARVILDIDSGSGRTLKSDGDLPAHVADSLAKLLHHCIPAGYTDAGALPIEDRGAWESI